MSGVQSRERLNMNSRLDMVRTSSYASVGRIAGEEERETMVSIAGEHSQALRRLSCQEGAGKV